MKAVDFIQYIKELPGFSDKTEIGFIFKEENGEYRRCHTVKDIFGSYDAISESGFAIVELEK